MQQVKKRKSAKVYIFNARKNSTFMEEREMDKTNVVILALQGRDGRQNGHGRVVGLGRPGRID